MTNCLEKAKEAYQNVLDNAEIEHVYDALTRHKEMALRTGGNLAQELTRFAAQGVKNRERSLMAKQLQDLKSIQAVVDNLQRIKQFQKAGITDAPLKAMKAKIGGTSLKIARGRESTELKMRRAGDKTLQEFASKINNELAPIWNSKKHQVEIADALIKVHRGEKGAHPIYERIANIVKEFQDRYVRGMREMGVDIHELDDRIAPNIHSPGKMLSLSTVEKRLARERGQSNYEFARDRWITHTFQNLDLKRTFTNNNIDFNDRAAVKEFMSVAFDNIVNKGKVTQEKTNVANKLSKPRILHWADAESLVRQNDTYGSGAIQDSIIRELRYGFSRLELMKDWGASPVTTLERTLRLLDQDQTLFSREGKGKEYQKLKNLLNALTRTDAEYAGTLGEFARNLRAFEFITKLGMVTIRSIPDLGLLATEAARHGIPGYQAIGEAVKNLVTGLPEQEVAALKDLLDVGIQHQLGSLSKFDTEGYDPSRMLHNGMRLSMKLNMLERWDHSMRATILSMTSRRLGQMRETSWEALGKENQDRLGLYNIDGSDWNAIRQSATAVAGNKRFITPDGIQQLPDNVLETALREKGKGRVNAQRIAQYREELENKLRDYLQDRQDHVILRPGVLDEYMLTFGAGLPQNDTWRQVVRLFTQFKLYSVAYARVPLGSVLFGKGARDFREATLGGKGDYKGMMKLTAYMMGLKYASMTVENLLQGLTPPSFTSKDTWMKMLSEGAGIYGMALGIDPTDIPGSVARSVTGAGISDLFKALRVGYDGFNDTFYNDDYGKTLKSLDKLTRGFIPKYPYSVYLLNNLLYGEWEDYANPGTREKYLANLQQKQGVQPIF